MTGAYAASFLPAILVPLLAVIAFGVMGLLFLYVESDA
jgi:photosystem I subunit 8